MQHQTPPPHALAPSQRLVQSNIEELAQAMYNHADPTVRANAESDLGASIGEDVAALATVLMNTLDTSAIAYAALRIPIAFKAHRDRFPYEQIQAITGSLARRAVALAESGTAPQCAVNFLHLAACKLNKLVLAEDGGFSIVAARAIELAPDGCDLSAPRAAAALRLLVSLVQTVNTFESSESSTFMQFGPHHFAATSFRDKHLKQVLQFTLRHLASLSEQSGCSAEAASAVVDLVRLIMTFDFKAIIVDEEEEASVTKSVYPTEWRDILLHSRETVELISAQHMALPPPLCTGLLRAMNGLVSAHPSFFETNEQKTQWHLFFMSQIQAAEGSQDGRLEVPEYCDALAEAIQRVISPPCSYRELHAAGGPGKVPARGAPGLGGAGVGFCEFIDFAARFSLAMFRLPFGRGSAATPTSLLKFWGRIDEERTCDMDMMIADMVEAFVKARITPTDIDRLDEAAIKSLQQQCEALPMMVGYCSGGLPLGRIQQAAETIGAENIVSTCSAFVWLCTISAALLRECFEKVREDSLGEASTFLQLVVEAIMAHRRLPSAHTNSSVERALVQCLSDVLRVFAPTWIPQHHQDVMENTFGERSEMFEFILTVVGPNMLSTGLDASVIRQSIELVAETCRRMSSTQIATLGFELPPAMSLPLSHSERTYKLRSPLTTVLYAVRLPGPFTAQDFAEFMAPIDEMIKDSPQHAAQPLCLAGWLRDLRGVVSAASRSPDDFGHVVDWILERAEIFRAIAATRQLPVVAHSFLKLLLQLVTPAHPTGRVFEEDSSAGIFLFKFVTAMMHDVLANSVSARAGELLHLLACGHSPDGVWSLLVKPLYVAMRVCRQCVVEELCSNGDTLRHHDNEMFDATVHGVIEICRCIPRRVLKDYPKADAALVRLLRALVEAHVTPPLSTLPIKDLVFLTEHTLSITRDTEEKARVLSDALHFLSFLSTVYPTVLVLQRGEALCPAGPPTPSSLQQLVRESLAQSLAQQTELWQEIVIAAMEVVTMQERGLTQAASAVFPIFECDPNMLQMYAAYLVGQYPPEKRESVAEALGRFCTAAPSFQEFLSKAMTFRLALWRMYT